MTVNTANAQSDTAHKGIMLIVFATFVFACQDAVTKHLAQTYATPQIIWIRYVFFAVFATIVAGWHVPIKQAVKSSRPVLQILRSLIILVEIGTFVVAVRVLSLVEIHSIMAEFGLPFRFPKKIEKAADEIPDLISDEEIKKRRDFRDVTTFTIDPHDAKDFDDALSIKELEKGKYEEAISDFYLGIGLPAEALEYFKHSPDWPTMVALAPTLAHDTRLASDLPPLERLTHLKVPTHIIVGENSPLSIHKVADQLKKSIQNASFTKLRNQDHMPSPESVLNELTKFLK